jgi:hypothetical protein
MHAVVLVKPTSETHSKQQHQQQHQAWNKIEGLSTTLILGSSSSHSLQNILQTFKKEGVILCKPFKMNGKKRVTGP